MHGGLLGQTGNGHTTIHLILDVIMIEREGVERESHTLEGVVKSSLVQ